MAKRAKRGSPGRRQSVKDLSPAARKGRTIRGGKAATIHPEVTIKTPAPSGPVPIPYPN
jgi:hypothetical protein